jgi:2-oxoglutarate ferredoxin oxidoreductase subunit delta
MGKERNQKGHFFPYIEEMDKCIGCQSCAIVCPEGAIELYKGVEANG